VRSAVLARLAPAHDAPHGGRRLPGRVAGDAASHCLRQTEQNESGARRLYGARGGKQSSAFVAEYMRNGGDAAAAFQAAWASA
jgi:hypothetical protein